MTRQKNDNLGKHIDEDKRYSKYAQVMNAYQQTI
jgi:hypothetical protein